MKKSIFSMRCLSLVMLIIGILNFMPVAIVGGEPIESSFILQSLILFSLIAIIIIKIKQLKWPIVLIPALIIDISYAYILFSLIKATGMNEILPSFIQINSVFIIEGFMIFIMNFLLPYIFVQKKEA